MKPSVVNGPAANIASSGPTGVHNQTVQMPSTPTDVGSGHRSSQSQSIISVDETMPYSRVVDRSELLSSKSLSLLPLQCCQMFYYYCYCQYCFQLLLNLPIFVEIFQVRISNLYKKAQLTQGLCATAPSFQDGRQPPSWILSNCK